MYTNADSCHRICDRVQQSWQDGRVFCFVHHGSLGLVSVRLVRWLFARAFEAAGAAVVLLDEECTSERLKGQILELLRDADRLKAMGENALSQVRPATVETIVEEILSMTFDSENN